MSKHARDTDLILKKNLKEGQVVYYFQQPDLTSDGIDYRGKKTTIQKLTFETFYTGRYNGECTLFLNEKGQKKKFYDSIKDYCIIQKLKPKKHSIIKSKN